MEHSEKVKKLLVKLENKLFDIFYTEVIHYYKKPGRQEMPLELDNKCVKIIRNFLSKAHIFFQGEHPKLKDVPNEAIFALKLKLNDVIENYNNPDIIQLSNNNEPFTLEQVLKARKNNKTHKSNLRERKLQSELRKKQAHELEEKRKRNKSFENKLNNFVNEPILKGITSKDAKLLSSRFHKMPPRPRTFTRSTKPEEQKKKMPPRPRTFTRSTKLEEPKKKMPSTLKPRGSRPSRRTSQQLSQPNVSLNN